MIKGLNVKKINLLKGTRVTQQYAIKYQNLADFLLLLLKRMKLFWRKIRLDFKKKTKLKTIKHRIPMLVIHAEAKCTFKVKSDDFRTLEIYSTFFYHLFKIYIAIFYSP